MKQQWQRVAIAACVASGGAALSLGTAAVFKNAPGQASIPVTGGQFAPASAGGAGGEAFSALMLPLATTIIPKTVPSAHAAPALPLAPTPATPSVSAPPIHDAPAPVMTQSTKPAETAPLPSLASSVAILPIPLPAPKPSLIMTSALPAATPEKMHREMGMASFYLSGGRTASGTIAGGMTAAHRKLPFGSRVKVKDVKTGKEVVVTITDRGPFKHSRVIDLSHMAARALGITGRGVARVEVVALAEK